MLTSISARQIVDMAGRTVIIPDEINRVVPYDNKTNVLLYPVAREKMIVKARSRMSPDLKYICKDYLRLPEIDNRNVEEMLKLNPDLMVVGAFVNDKAGLENYIRFSERTKIPVVFVDIELMNLDKSYEFLGDLLNCKDSVEQYIGFIRRIYSQVQESVDLSVGANAYLANENNGLRTAPQGSRHAQLFDIMKVENVADVGVDNKGFGVASIEQVLMWNPEYIFCLTKGVGSPYRTIMKSSLWKNVSAVKKQRVFIVPSEPFPWFDMPPSVNRIAGLIWLMEVFYDRDEAFTQSEIKEFYKLFYSYELTEKEYRNLFRWQ